jgi:hypothetical protein
LQGSANLAGQLKQGQFGHLSLEISVKKSPPLVALVQVGLLQFAEGYPSLIELRL